MSYREFAAVEFFTDGFLVILFFGIISGSLEATLKKFNIIANSISTGLSATENLFMILLSFAFLFIIFITSTLVYVKSTKENPN